MIWQQVANTIDGINEKVGKSVSWINFLLVLLVCFDVTNRRLFSESSAWINELEWHLFALVFLIGAGFALKNDRHVRVDLFYARFSEKEKALVNFLGTLLFLLPWASILIYYSFGYAMESFTDRETSPDPGGLPARYIIKFAIVVGLFLLLLQGISIMINSLIVLRKKEGTEG